MHRHFWFASFLAALCAPTLAYAEPACLPQALFPEEEDALMPALDLGLVAGTPTLCAHNDAEHAGYLGCWAIDPATGALSASTAVALPGHSLRGKTDAKGCIEGHCVVPPAAAETLLPWATSTDGKHAVILNERALHVFDAASKMQTVTIPLSDDSAPGHTNVSNEAMEVLYTGNALYVLGADAGPYMAVWAYKDDGTRLGVVTRSGQVEEDVGGFSVYSGAVNVLGDADVGLADIGLQKMLLLSANGAREEITRSVDSSPCTKDEMEYLFDIDQLSEGCKATVEKNLQPYFDVDPVRLPSGDLLAALSGKGRGAVAILDGKTLAEKQRIELKRCP